MILDQDTRPERQIYHLGAVLLGVLLGDTGERVDPHLAYERMNSVMPVSSGAFILTLDWLFLLGAITADDRGITRCS
jgi:hypothetical protein